MRCSHSEADNRAGVACCEECEASLGEVCHRCAASIPPDARFCGACGEPAPAPRAAAAAPPAAEGEHEQPPALPGPLELLRFARNRVHRQWADALLLVDGIPLPISFPIPASCPAARNAGGKMSTASDFSGSPLTPLGRDQAVTANA